MTRKWKMLLVLCLSLALVISACGSNSNNNKSGTNNTSGSNNQKSDSNQSSDKKDEIVELSFWSWVPEPGDWDDLIGAFEAEHPNIKINYSRDVKAEYEQKLLVAVQAGQAPDIMGLQMGALVNNYQSILEPLAPYAEKSLGANWKDEFKSAPMERAAEYNYTAMPTGIVTTPYIVYDVDMFEQAGAVPPTTYEELKETIRKFEEANLDGVLPRLGIAGGEWLSGLRDFFLNIVNQVAPGKIYEATAGEIPFTDPGIVRAAEVLQQFYKDDIFQDGNLGIRYNPQLNEMFFKERRLPMFMIGSWALRDIALKEENGYGDRNFGMVPFPTVEGGQKLILTDGDLSLAVNKDSKHKEEAWTFIEFMLTGEWQTMLSQRFVFVPVKEDVGFDYSLFTNELERTAAEMVPEMVAEHAGGARFLDYAEIDNALFENLQRVAAGDATPLEAMENVQRVSEGIQR